MTFGDVAGLLVLLSAFIALSAIVASAYKRRLSYKERALELTASQTAEKAAQYANQTARLEGRVRVLERIVTESLADGKGAAIALQIEALRDTPAPEVTPA